MNSWVARLCVSALLVFALSSVGAAQAVQPSARELRLSFKVEDVLIQEAQRAYVWRIAWTAIYGGLAVGAVAAVPVFSDSDRPSLWIGAISSGVSALFSWLFPIEAEASTYRLTQLREQHGSAARRARVNLIYAAASADEKSRVSWPWHALNAVLALIPAVVLWVGYDQLSAGLMQFAGGVVLGEAAFFTQPTRLTTNTPGSLARASCLSFSF